MNPAYTAALQYASRGWRAFPVNGKIPATPHGFKDASAIPEEVTALWDKYPAEGVAVATGNGIGVIDIDPRNGGDDGFEALCAGRKLPETPCVLTGGGGRHFYFSLPRGIAFPKKAELAPGVDWQADGAYVVAPPSPHASGKRYEWEASSHPDDVPLASLPDWLLAVITSGQKSTKSTGTPQIPEKIKAGARHEWLTKIAGKLRWQNLGEKAILQALLAENESGRFDPPCDRAEIERIASDYAKKAAAPEPAVSAAKEVVLYRPKRLCDLIGKASEQLLHPELRPKGLKTGLIDLDYLTGGLHRGEVAVLGARTSHGKSSLALRIAEGVAREHCVLCFSVEMSELRVATNLLIGMAKIDSHRARSDKPLEAEEGARLVDVVPDAKSLYLWIDDSPALDADTFAARCRAFVKENPDTLVILDYIQIVRNKSDRPRQEQVAEISRTVQSVALELNIPILAMAQLNREVENRPDHEPNISDLRESGSIESDARCVMLLHRPGIYDKAIGPTKAILNVAKNSNGPTGKIELFFNAASMRFENAKKFPSAQHSEEE